MAVAYQQGRYWGKVTAQGLGVSKKKETPQFTLTFLVRGLVNLEDPDGDLIACSQNERTVYLYLTEKTIERTLEELQRLGFNGTSLKLLDPKRAGFHDFTGTECALICEHEPYNNELQERWRIAGEGGGPVSKPLDEKQIRELDNLFAKELKKNAKPNGAPAARTVKQTAPAAEEAAGPHQDIPF